MANEETTLTGSDNTEAVSDVKTTTETDVAKDDALRKASDPKADAATAEETPAETADEAKSEEKSKDGKADKGKEGAPEKYEFQVPEGMELDAAMVEKFEPVARELGLTQEQAQKIADVYSERIATEHQEVEDTWYQTREDWVKAAKSDKEIGGTNFDTMVASGKKALASFGTPELTEALDTTGLGDHPEFIRFAARIGKAIGEDKFIHGGPTGAQKSIESKLYPSMKS